jgi:hypothetical protein
MITELLRHPPGAARPPERPDGRTHGLPDLTRARLITAPQPRHEDGISPDSVGCARFPVARLLAVDVGVPVVDGVHI